MSFYVLEILCGETIDGILLDADPYRITWENKESGEIVSRMFINAILDIHQKKSEIQEKSSIGFHFYKYSEPFEFGDKLNNKSELISNVYIPTNCIEDIKITDRKEYINDMVNWALSELEAIKKSPEN
jgi:hypothetical protein